MINTRVAPASLLSFALFFFGGSAAAEEASSFVQDVIYFQWRPPLGPRAAYDLQEKEDQHRIVLMPKVEQKKRYPVVVGFHGQPKRGKNPRDYNFLKSVMKTVSEMAKSSKIEPFVLVLPVFRFTGQNWPGFDGALFRKEVENILKKRGIETGDWFVFGHSGAAGCGGDGLNLAYKMSPSAVGFFDTCLGQGWRDAVLELKKRRIETLNIHSVETAGFRPKQSPEYQSTFDFGRAYSPLGLSPVDCPSDHPGERLRDQPFRCASTEDLKVLGFVVDTGEGSEAHETLLPVALSYFIKRYLGVEHR